MKEFPKGVSIVICTYNGLATLEHTLFHLAQQLIETSVELILVDNASTDGTKAFCDGWWEKHGHADMTYRSLIQTVPGKTYAQEMGFEAAQYEYLLVVDDDNLLDANYVQLSYDIMESDPKIGALGGWCEAEHEEPKPEWFDVNEKYFAVGKQGSQSGDITDQKGCVYGAGMVLRKSHWKQLYQMGYQPLLSCRKGDSLSSGGDTEYCYALRLLGYKIWYDDRLYFKHFMMKGRVKLAYISRLKKALSESNFRLRVYTDEMNGIERHRSDFFREFIKELLSGIIPMSVRLIFGNFNQREYAKDYFRTLGLLVRSFDEYDQDRAALRKWLYRSKIK